MCPALLSRLRVGASCLLAVSLAGLGCGGDGGTDIVFPSLSISTSTSGAELDPDGYSFAVDGQAPQPIGLQATVTVDRLPQGQHTVELSGVAANCATEGENPRTVSVTNEATATVAFAITCGAATGAVQVVTTTSGPGSDPDGFTLLFDGADQGPIGSSSTATLTGLQPGSHEVGLAGLAANCQLAGDNPRTVTVEAGQTAELEFAVTCAAPGPQVGNLEVSVSTTGVDLDPDGYQLSIDGGTSQPIGTNATVTLANVPAAEHTIQLLGLAGNCSLAAENPARATVPIGGTVRVVFAVTCTTGENGSVEVSVTTSGTAIDTDGYTISVDGGPGQVITVNGSRTVTGLTPGDHSIQLGGVAANCQVTGDNPIGVAVGPGETARVSFVVTCAATVGSLRVTVEGLPAGVAAAVTVSGPNSFSELLSATRTLTALTPGSYAVSAEEVVNGGTTYTPAVGRPTVPVAAGATATVTVSYTEVAVVPTLNLRIDGLYLTQSTQTSTSSVPLVANRAGYLRVFVVANEGNTVAPRVGVQLFRDGTLAATRTITAPQGSVPTRIGDAEATLGRSWNLPIEASLIRSGLSIVAEVDDGDAVEESNEADNRFPSSGRKSLLVRTVPAAAIRFVRVVQTANNLEGTIGSTDNLMAMARRLYPLNGIQTGVRSTVLTVTGPLQPNDVNSWGQVLSDLDGARAADPDGSSWTYYGVVKLNYGRQDGLVGQAFQGLPLAIGWDDPVDASRVVAHELGHTWNMRHTPCGNPPDQEAGYPYGNGIGVYGLDVATETLKAPALPDIMGYCVNPWISDYTFRRVMDFRQANPGRAAVASAVPQPSLLIWGRIVNGRPVLEPAFEIVTRPSLPTRPGPYSVSATRADGSRLFTLSFDVARVDGSPAGNGHFAFAVPLDQASASGLGSLRLEGPTGGAVSSRTLAQLRSEPGSESIVARREGENVSLRWNAVVHPMIMVRDPDTGEVLSFVRGGTALVRTAKSELDLEVSDGVRSQRLRLAINRP